MTLTQITKAGLHDIALDHVFTIGASGTDHYTFQGEGLNGTVNDPTLYLTRGKTYRFENGTGAHPIRIQSTSGASGTAYNTGVTNNAGSGTVIVEVQHDAPDVLYYQCTSHANMNGIIYVTGALADGNVTTAKLADDAVNNDKLANSVVASIAANTAKNTNATHTGDVTGSGSLTIANNAVTTAKIATNAVTTSEIAADAVTGAKISDDAVDNEHIANNAVRTLQIIDNAVNDSKIADQAVTLAKLEHGTSSNNGKFLRANNGADPTFETVNTDLVADTSPQLGGNLDSNGQDIVVNGGLLEVAHTSCHVDFMETSTTNHRLRNGSGNFHIQRLSDDKSTAVTQFLVDGGTGAVELYKNGTKAVETKDFSAGTDSGEMGLRFANKKAIQFHDNQIGIFSFSFSMSANTWTTMFTHDSYVAATIHVSSVHNAGFSSATWIMSKSGSGGNSTVRTGLNDAYGPARLEMGINSNDLRIRSSYSTYGYAIVLVQYNFDGIKNIN